MGPQRATARPPTTEVLAPMAEAGYKRCTQCGEEKGLGEFHRRKASKDGREATCKKCRAGYYQANKERMDARNEAWRKANPERAAEIRYNAVKKWEASGAGKEWRKANPGKLAEYRRGYGKRHPEKVAAWRAEFRLKNPGYFAGHNRDRRSNVEIVKPDELALRDAGRCGICGEPLFEPIELDHIIPITRGGDHTEDNCQLAHRSCNRQKNNRLPSEYGEIRPFKDPSEV